MFEQSGCDLKKKLFISATTRLKENVHPIIIVTLYNYTIVW